MGYFSSILQILQTTKQNKNLNNKYKPTTLPQRLQANPGIKKIYITLELSGAMSVRKVLHLASEFSRLRRRHQNKMLCHKHLNITSSGTVDTQQLLLLPSGRKISFVRLSL